MRDENHSDWEKGREERGEMRVEVKRPLPKRDGRTSVNKIGQTDRSDGRKQHLKFLIGDNRDNDQTNAETENKRDTKERMVIFQSSNDLFPVCLLV